jgi:hypothetical protein
MAGNDPFAVIAAEHVADIVPEPLRLEAAEKAARVRLDAASKP